MSNLISEPVVMRLLTLLNSMEKAEFWVKQLRSIGIAARLHNISTPEMLEKAMEANSTDIFLVEEDTSYITAEQAIQASFNHKKDIPTIVLLSETPRKSAGFWLNLGAKDAITANNSSHLIQAIQRETAALEIRRQLSISRQALKESESRCNLLLKNTSLAIAYIHEGVHVDVNDAYLKLFGYENADDFFGMPLIDMITPEYQESIKAIIKAPQKDHINSDINCSMINRQGQPVAIKASLSETRYDNEPCLQIVITPLDNLPRTTSPKVAKRLISRIDFIQHLKEIPEKNTILYLQLDNYSQIRKNAGIEGVLATQDAIADIINELLPNSLVSQYVDNIFTASTAVINSEQFNQLRHNIKNKLIVTNNGTLHTSASIGYAFNDHNFDGNALLEQARIASDLCKKQGGDQALLYSQQAIIQDQASNGDENAIAIQILEKNQLKLNFQPVISLTGEGEEHYEVQLRLAVNVPAFSSTTEFLNTAKRYGLMQDVDKWVLRQSLQALVAKNQSEAKTRLMIHISTESIQNPEFTNTLATLLESSSLSGELITLQITELDAHRHLLQLIEMIKQLKPFGCRIGIIQFTGGSESIKILTHLHPEMIKLDGLFARRLERNNQERLTETIRILREQGISNIIFPKIESSQALAKLWRLGVDYVQGSYLQPPMDNMTFNFNS